MHQSNQSNVSQQDSTELNVTEPNNNIVNNNKLPNKNKDNVLKKRAIIFGSLIIVVFIASCIAWYVIGNSTESRRYAYIYQAGALIETIDLSAVTEDYTFTIEGSNGAFNTIEIHDHKIHVIDASCPDSICIQTGYSRNNSLPITCLPNRLIIKVTSEPIDDNSNNGIDIITY